MVLGAGFKGGSVAGRQVTGSTAGAWRKALQRSWVCTLIVGRLLALL